MDNAKKYLICDCVGSAQLEIISNESTGSSTGSIKFRGKFQEANCQNKNKRIYSYDILERERGRLDAVIQERRLFGELDHPSDSIIHLENASHLVTKLWWNGQALFGEGEILPTPAGKILECIIRAGIPIGISSRGVGNAKTNADGTMIIDGNYRLITFDAVADPSTPEAFANAFGEHHSFYQNNVSSKNIEKKSKKIINNTNESKIDPKILIGFVKGIFQESIENNSK